MNNSEFEKKKIYSETSGTITAVDSNVNIHLNEYGLYEETLIDPTIELSEKAKYVSPNFNSLVNESDIANELYSTVEGIDFDKRIGFYKGLYVGYVSEGNYRKNASSGGMGTWILKELFDNDLIDYVIHVKKNNDINDEAMFIYEISSTSEEIRAGAKTRYYPVELSQVISRIRETPGRYAVIGIPSFIYSLRLLAKQDEVINERLKYTVGLICGHQKSTKFSESMAWQVGIKPGDLLDIDFRYKLLDRRANQYGVKMTGIIDGNKETVIVPKSELYGQNWGWGFFKPIASDYTDDVFNETADIVLGDAWLPEYTHDSKGTNIVIVRNPEINVLIKNAMRSQRLEMDIVDKEKVFKSQASHYRHTYEEMSFRIYKKDKNNEYRPKKRVQPKNDNISKNRKKIQKLREKISMESHFTYQEAVKKDDFSYFIDEMSKTTTIYDKIYENMKKMEHAKELGFIKSGIKIAEKLIQKIKMKYTKIAN